MKVLFRLFPACLALLLILTASVTAQDDIPTWSELEPGMWTTISPGGDTICSNGTPYSYFVRAAAEPSDDLLIHFQGGGACWFKETCDLSVSPSYDPFVDESDNPVNYPVGIFDLENTENPFSTYNMVMVPYCTGDVHIGNTETTYGEGEDAVTIQHNGYINATTVLDWTFENVQDPESVFVTGCSAGAIPSPFYTEFVAQAYPDARIDQLGDAAGGYRNPPLANTVFEAWGTPTILTDAYADIETESLTFESFYSVNAANYPDITFSQYNASFDAVQASFLMLGGLMEFNLDDLLAQNYADIEAEAADNFASFTVGGDSHCVTVDPAFYTYAANGQRVVDWVADLAAGESVETVTCEACETVEIIDAS
jgi:hypothetical protein